jgi:hypothetical protein
VTGCGRKAKCPPLPRNRKPGEAIERNRVGDDHPAQAVEIGRGPGGADHAAGIVHDKDDRLGQPIASNIASKNRIWSARP